MKGAELVPTPTAKTQLPIRVPFAALLGKDRLVQVATGAEHTLVLTERSVSPATVLTPRIPVFLAALLSLRVTAHIFHIGILSCAELQHNLLKMIICQA